MVIAMPVGPVTDVDVHHVVQFSTGAGSAEVAARVVREHGVAATVLLSADTLVEDEDNWRFASEVHDWLGRPEWVRLVDGRTPMEVGRDHRVVPNNRMAVCSRVLKRELLRDYIDGRWGGPGAPQALIYLGFDWTEEHRLQAAVGPWEPYEVRAPLMEPPFLQKADILTAWRERGIEPPRLYAQGFAHANCGGGCVRGGQAQWELLLRVNRGLYLGWEAEEERTRRLLGKDVTILRDRRAGVVGGQRTRPLPLRVFRERLDAQPSLFDADDWGACGCFMDEDRIAAVPEDLREVPVALRAS